MHEMLTEVATDRLRGDLDIRHVLMLKKRSSGLTWIKHGDINRTSQKDRPTLSSLVMRKASTEALAYNGIRPRSGGLHRYGASLYSASNLRHLLHPGISPQANRHKFNLHSKQTRNLINKSWPPMELGMFSQWTFHRGGIRKRLRASEFVNACDGPNQRQTPEMEVLAEVDSSRKSTKRLRDFVKNVNS